MTEKDNRAWIKLSLDYLDNPKIDALSDSAILLHLSLLLRAGQQKKDGAVSARACKARGEGPFKELVKQGLIHRVDALTYQLHDYVKHQTEAKIIQARKQAGGRGGHTKNHVKRLLYDESCQHCQDDFEGGLEWLKEPGLVAKGPDS